MAFPQVLSVTESSFASDSTSHNVSYPASVPANNLLVMAVAVSNGTNTSITTPSGYTELVNSNSGAARLGVFVKSAAGTEGGGTETVTIGLSETLTAHVYCIYDWGGTIADDIDQSAAQNGSDAAPNCGNCTAGWGSADTLWLALFSAADDDETVSSGPTGFTNVTGTVSGAGTNAGCTSGSARSENTASSLNPDAFALSGSEAWVSVTLAIEPGSSGSAGAVAPLVHHRKMLGMQ